MFEYLIVADDYTGASETAAKFMKGGYQALITLDPGSLGSLRNCATVAVDTETFFASPEEARKKLLNVAQDLLPWKGSTVFFKRIEAGLRGNVGPEVKAISEKLAFEHVIVVSAFSRGRKAVEEGTVYLDSDESMSPLTVTTSKSASMETTANVLSDAGMAPVRVTLDEVRSEQLTDTLAQKGCFCLEAESDEDLRSIVTSVLRTTPAKDVLWVGSTGLAEALALAPRPFLIVVGTAHPRSIRQARQVLDQAMAYPVELRAEALASSAKIKEELQRVTGEAEALLRCGQSVLLAATLKNRFVRGAYPDDDIEGFLGFMADTVRSIMGRVKLGGLCITGGDCTVRVMQRAKAESVFLLEEIQEGITCSKLSGGSFDGLRIVSKSGALGGERALIHCMEYLLEEGDDKTI